MEKMKCDIIQDLIPSYVDKICSDATRECVEEHIADCKECGRMVALCKGHVPSADKIEQESLNGFRKIRKIGQLKGIVCCGLVLFLMGYLGSVGLIVRKNVLSDSIHIILQIVCQVLLLLSGIGFVKKRKADGSKMSDRKKEETNQGQKKGAKKSVVLNCLLSIVPVAISIYFLVIEICLGKVLLDAKESFWGMEIAETGIFVVRQIIVGYIIIMGGIIYELFRILKQGNQGNWILCLYVLCGFFLLQYVLWLGRMDTLDTLMSSLAGRMVWTVLIGVTGMGVSIFVSWFHNKKQG